MTITIERKAELIKEHGLADGDTYYHHNAMFQPAGGMDMIAKAFAREVGSLIRFNTKVTEIKQDEKGVTVQYVDATNGGNPGTLLVRSGPDPGTYDGSGPSGPK